MPLCEVAFGVAREPCQQQISHSKPDDAIAEELQALEMVGGLPAFDFPREARMAECCLQQRRVGEAVAEGPFESLKIAVGGFPGATQCR